MSPPAGCSGVVVFNYSEWIVQYPEFAAVTQPVAQSYFNHITIGGLVDNTPQSVIQNLFERTILLNLAVSHLAYLNQPQNAGAVGRVSSATQGSVSAQLDYPQKGGSQMAWWNQSKYGAEYYASTAKYRTFNYFPPAAPIRTVPGGAAFFPRRW